MPMSEKLAKELAKFDKDIIIAYICNQEKYMDDESIESSRDSIFRFVESKQFERDNEKLEKDLDQFLLDILMSFLSEQISLLLCRWFSSC